MKLYWSPRSPFVLKVVIVAEEMGVAQSIERIHSDSAMHAPSDELTAYNPLSKMPTLVLDDGEALFDSVVICEYLAGLGHDPSLIPMGAARLSMLRWIAVGDGLMDVLVLWRNERDRPEGRSMDSWTRSFQQRTVAALDWLERRASVLADEPFNLGHVSVGSALCYLDLRFAHLAWRDGRPALAIWHEAFLARPAVARATADYGVAA